MVYYKRGEIYFADLGVNNGSEQGGVRPVLIIQNDIGNKYSPTVIVACITSKINKAKLPTHIEIGKESGLLHNSLVLMEQIKTIDKKRLKNYIGTVPSEVMVKCDEAIKISLEIKDVFIENDKAKELSQVVKDLDVTIDIMLEYKSRSVTELTQIRAIKMMEFLKYCNDNNLSADDYYKEDVVLKEIK